jgi:hypothetical protein
MLMYGAVFTPPCIFMERCLRWLYLSWYKRQHWLFRVFVVAFGKHDRIPLWNASYTIIFTSKLVLNKVHHKIAFQLTKVIHELPRQLDYSFIFTITAWWPIRGASHVETELRVIINYESCRKWLWQTVKPSTNWSELGFSPSIHKSEFM